ncbi:MAG: hypothetical protein ACFBSF_19245 [Leptolyngbyaceae cyanobacterium]
MAAIIPHIGQAREACAQIGSDAIAAVSNMATQRSIVLSPWVTATGRLLPHIATDRLCVEVRQQSARAALEQRRSHLANE